MQFKNIPQYLKDHQHFCLWRYETDRNGRLTKVPYNPKTLHHAQPNNLKTFSDFQTVKDKFESTGDFDGIGIKVTEDIVAIDLDHCVDNRIPNEVAQEIIGKFPNSYIEISPSGTGLRIILLNSSKLGFNPTLHYTKKGNVEFYTSSSTRYVTVTGNVFQEGDVVENHVGVQWLLKRHLTRKQPKQTPDSVYHRPSILTDDEVFAKASNATNNEKFLKLWNGDHSAYGSQSEADVALCSIIGFYCNGNYDQIDRLFRKSGLYREKWDSQRGGDTYGKLTILKSLEGEKDFYKPIIVPNAKEDFGEELVSLQDFHPEDPKAYPFNEIGAGRLFADFYKSTLRYVPKRKSWFHYADGIWQKDTGAIQAMKACMNLADALYVHALSINDNDQRKIYIDYVVRWQKFTFRNNLLKDAQVHYPIDPREFDSDPYTFNCRNGTLNLRTLAFNSHSADDLLTKMSPVTYDPIISDERWTQFIDEIMSGDKEKAKFLQKIFGYGISGDTRFECFFILYGLLTRNGKGTLCESVLQAMGTYGITSKAETIAQRVNANSSAPSEDVARLAGVRFANISEPNKGLVLDTAKVKTMTGNDTLNARFLHENSFDFKPRFKLYINTNYLPQINDMTIFTSDRLIIIPFNRHFDESEQDRNLKHYFSGERQQTAILNWLVEGFQFLQKEGLRVPKSVREAIHQHQEESDKFKQFIDECTVKDVTAEERTADVYARYRGWCLDNGYHFENKKNFNSSLATVTTIKRKRPKGSRNITTMVIGLKLLSEFLE